MLCLYFDNYINCILNDFFLIKHNVNTKYYNLLPNLLLNKKIDGLFVDVLVK